MNKAIIQARNLLQKSRHYQIEDNDKWWIEEETINYLTQSRYLPSVKCIRCHRRLLKKDAITIIKELKNKKYNSKKTDHFHNNCYEMRLKNISKKLKKT